VTSKPSSHAKGSIERDSVPSPNLSANREPTPELNRARSQRRRCAPYLGIHRWVATGAAVAAIVLSTFLSANSGRTVTAAADPIAVATDIPSARHPLASHSMPPFITAPGDTDVLLVCMAVVLVAAVLGAGVFFFWLHSLPERMVHNSTKVHFDIVAVLGLLSLFTHIHLFWVAALLIALVRIPEISIPDFSGLLGRMAGSLEKISDAESAAVVKSGEVTGDAPRKGG